MTKWFLNIFSLFELFVLVFNFLHFSDMEIESTMKPIIIILSRILIIFIRCTFFGYFYYENQKYYGVFHASFIGMTLEYFFVLNLWTNEMKIFRSTFVFTIFVDLRHIFVCLGRGLWVIKVMHFKCRWNKLNERSWTNFSKMLNIMRIYVDEESRIFQFH